MTPLHKKGAFRFTKTIDSVEMAKKKKSTRNKRKDDSDSPNEEELIQNNTMPANLHSSALKRRVTFTADSYCIENLRGHQEQHSPPGFRTNNSLAKRPSILRNSGFRTEEDEA